MARNVVPYTLMILMIIGVIICSFIPDFFDAIIYQQPPLVRRRRTWTPTYHDVSDLNACINKCNETHKKFQSLPSISSLNIPDSSLATSSLLARRVLSSLPCWSFASLSPPLCLFLSMINRSQFQMEIL
ncbi:hypothetical protein AAHE18_10G191300 [Arachis hypogaea]